MGWEGTGSIWRLFSAFEACLLFAEGWRSSLFYLLNRGLIGKSSWIPRQHNSLSDSGGIWPFCLQLTVCAGGLNQNSWTHVFVECDRPYAVGNTSDKDALRKSDRLPRSLDSGEKLCGTSVTLNLFFFFLISRNSTFFPELSTVDLWTLFVSACRQYNYFLNILPVQLRHSCTTCTLLQIHRTTVLE